MGSGRPEISGRARNNSRERVAVAAVAGVAFAAVVASVKAGRSSHPTTGAGAVRASATTTVNRPPEEVYRMWRDIESLPRFMAHLQSVRPNGQDRSHWVATAPGGGAVEWDAEVVEDIPGQLIAWRSLEGADVPNSGRVRLAPAPGGRGTEVAVDLEYQPPAGAIGAAAARLLGEEPNQQVKDDLRRFKQVIETGDVVISDGTPGGTRNLRQFRQGDARP